MTELTPSFITELNQRHADIVYAIRKTVTDAIVLGGLLVQAKGNMDYGDWQEWCATNLKYSIRTAQRYMLMYDQREAIAARKIDEITDAYKLISDTPLNKTGAAVVRTTPAAPAPEPRSDGLTTASNSPLAVKWEKPRGSLRDAQGRSVPLSIESAWRQGAAVQELLLSVSSVRRRVKEATDARNPVWSEVIASDVISRLDTVYYALKCCIPYALCPYCQGVKNADCVFCNTRGYISEARWNGPIPEELKRMVTVDVEGKE